jgi:hypothetical protein
MGNRIIFVILILLASHLPIIDSTSAQWVPAVDLESQAIHPSGNLEINVTAESNKTDYADCTVTSFSIVLLQISRESAAAGSAGTLHIASAIPNGMIPK